MTARTWLTDMSQEECWSLVAHAAVGRLGVVVDGRPQVFPVCHSYSDGFITFPTNEGTKMHAALQWPWVCFEVDMVDPAGNTGWSVMVDGRAEEVTDRAAIERASAVRTA